ncbi:hypothetical protein B0H10DRAFT_2213993 [Mycena sp. CBHHK59/15]|nr:hypothetical protein B0H10DRAFT_2213993 [Mycena sp. CBHHK59/15]
MLPKIRLPPSKTTPPSSQPRNSFTETDYYRKTREEIYSPLSRAQLESSHSGSPLQDQYTGPAANHLPHIREDNEPDAPASEEGEGEGDERHLGKRTAVFWRIFSVLFGKWRRQKADVAHDKGMHRSSTR